MIETTTCFNRVIQGCNRDLSESECREENTKCLPEPIDFPSLPSPLPEAPEKEPIPGKFLREEKSKEGSNTKGTGPVTVRDVVPAIFIEDTMEDDMDALAYADKFGGKDGADKDGKEVHEYKDFNEAKENLGRDIQAREAREQSEKAQSEAYDHSGKAAKEALNGNFGDAIDHAVKANQKDWEAAQKGWEADRLENQREKELSDKDKKGEGHEQSKGHDGWRGK